jgi:predicted RNA binding protein YcfA (HicA-like mRNA interferase family)
MNPRLPVVSGKEVIRVLERFGYVVVRQKGSHVRLRRASDPQKMPVTVPMHDELAFGTLKKILQDAKVSVEQLISFL